MAKPAAVSDVEKFLALLEKSGLLAAPEMAQVREAAAGLDDVKALARQLIKQGTLTKWQAMQLLGGGTVLTLGKYKLLNQIGSGQHGRVYLAEHASMGRRVVLRVLPRRAAEKPELVKRFLQEAQAAAALDHRNIMHVYDVNSEGDRYYLVMEYVGGRSLLDTVLEDGPLAPAQAVDYIRQATEGLAVAHAGGMLHRELSPAKLIVDEQGTVKIVEMGISGLDEPSETASTDISGGPATAGAYLAPEQCQSRPECDQRTDIYSLGATLYFLLSGKSPLAPSETEKPRDLLQLRSDVPESLVEILERMLAKNRDDRFASAEELAQSLDGWLAKQRPAPPVRRKPAAEEAPVIAAKPPAKAKPAIKTARPLDEAESPVSDIPSFDAPRKVSKPKKKAPAAVALDTDEAPAEKPAKKGPPVVIIAAAAGGGVALLLVVGLIAFLVMGGEAKQPVVASNDGANQPASAPAQPPAAASNNEQEPKEPEEEPGLPKIGEGVADPEPMPDPMANEPAAPMPADENPPSDPPADSGSDSSPANEPKTEEVKPEEPKKEEPKKEEPKKEEPKPAPKPFAAFAKAVELPSLGEPNKPNDKALEPVALGPVKLQEGLMFLRLNGGDKVSKKATFSIANANGGLAERDWEISAADPRGMASLVVAKLSYKEDQLFFQWTQEAVSNAATFGALANCSITMASGPESHTFAMRTPIEVPAIVLTLDKAMRSDIEIPNMPDPASIKVEIVKVEAGLPAKVQKQVLEAEKDVGGVMFGDKPAEQVLLLAINTSLRRSLQVTVSPFYNVEPQGNPLPFKPKTVAAAAARVAAQREQISQGIVFLQQAPGGNADEKKKQVEAMNKQMDQLNGYYDKFQKLGEHYNAVNNSGQVHFKVVFMPDESERIDLVVTKPAELPTKPDITADDAPKKIKLGKPDDEE